MNLFSILLIVLAISVVLFLILATFKPIKFEIIKTTKVIQQPVQLINPKLMPKLDKETLAKLNEDAELNPFTEFKQEDVPTVSLDAVVAAANRVMGIDVDSSQEDSNG